MASRLQQRGVTLIELMIAMAIGLIIVLAASTAFLAGKKLFTTDTDVQAVQDTVRFTRYVVQNLIRQAGYSDYAPDHRPDGMGVIASSASLSASSNSLLDLSVAGASNTKVGSTDKSFGSNGSDETLGNDSLMVRFFGRTKAEGAGADGTMVDCYGASQAGPAKASSAADDRAWSFFFVALAGDGEPELYCKYRTATKEKGFKSAPLARGVEKFKVVYGYDGDDDSVPDTWLEAKEISAMATKSGAGANAEWRNVVAVRVGMVVRSSRPNVDLKQVGDSEDYRLFPLGKEFPAVAFDPPDDGRFRAVSTFTVMLRNVHKDPA